MKKIEYKFFPTGKRCPVCLAEIVERVSLKDGEAVASSLNITLANPMKWLNSDYISCPACSIQYGQPNFISILKSMPYSETEDLKWELDLVEATVRREIELKDITNVIYESVKNLFPLDSFSVGTTVYIDNGHIYNDLMLSKYLGVQLSKEKGSPVYMIKADCFE